MSVASSPDVVHAGGGAAAAAGKLDAMQAELGAEFGDFVVLGKIAAPYGLQGAVKVYPFADDPAAWSRLACWWLGREDVPRQLWVQSRLIRCKLHNDLLIVELDAARDRNAAEAITGLLVGVPRAQMPAVGVDEYYWGDLVGLEVINTRDEPLGRILGLIDTPAQPVLRVGDGVSDERLLPFVAAVVLEVDLPAKRVRVEWESDW